jgi:PAS domain S-box-containing protein
MNGSNPSGGLATLGMSNSHAFGEARLRSILDTAGEAFVSIDAQGSIVEWNARAEATFGWSREEAIGRPLADTIIPPPYRKAHEAAMERFLETGKGPMLEKRIEMSALHRSGREFPVELALSATITTDGWCFHAFLHDISERKLAEEKLKRSQQMLEEAQQVAHIGSWQWDTGLDLISWSDELYRIFGLDPESFGASYAAFLERVHPADRERVDCVVRRALKDHEPFSFSHRIVRPDGTVRVLYGRGQVAANGGGAVRMFGTAHDVTEQKLLEDEIELGRELALAIGEASTVESALELTLAKICQRTSWAYGQAWFRNGSYLECSSAWHATAEGLEPFRRRSESMTFERGVGLAGEAWEAGRPVWMNDVGRNPRFARASFAREVGFAAGVAVPVLASDEVVAVMEFFVLEPRDEDGGFTAVVSAVAAQLGSLIERKRAAEALGRSEECFRSLIDSFDDHAVFMLDASGHVSSWNRGAERITGYSADEIMRYHVSRFYPADDVETGKPEHQLEQAAARRRYEGSDWRVRRDGSRFWAGVEISALRADDGELRGFSCVTRDLSERKRTAEELERLRAIVEHSEDAIIGATLENGIVTTWNRGAERLFGYSAREMMGRPLQIVLPPEERSSQQQMLTQVREGRRVELRETRCVRKNGALLDMSLTVSPVKDVAGEVKGVSLIARDITERKRAQAALEQALGTYLDREVADHILLQGPALEAEEVDVTMMFVDIRGFTAFATRFEPREVVATLNCLFELAVPIIARHGGHVDKFVGDGLLAVFGAPRPEPDHACRALRAGLEISEAAHKRFEGDLEIGIGIDSGPVVTGNVGGGGRLDFTVIGNAVNMAARVESATRDTGDTVLITEATKNRVGDCDVLLEERRNVQLKGLPEAVLFAATAGAEQSRGPRPSPSA